jgi:hypothetical protein
VAERYFTPDEANELLEEVRPLAEEMVRRRRALVEADRKRTEITTAIAGNGGSLRPQELTEVTEATHAESEGLAQCIQAIQELGAVVKDLDEGLVDFPALRDGEEVLLCWRVGEDEIRYWHGLDEGFAGRKELPL